MAPRRPASVTLEIDVAGLTARGADAKDVELAERIVRVANELREAMDAAALAEYRLKFGSRTSPARAAEYGSEADSFVCRVAVYRKVV